MRIRYTKDTQGRMIKSAEIYTQEEHGLDNSRIDADAVFICRKLRQAGFETYIVGGAVRDLLLGKQPKDFDIATAAHPRSVKKVLPYSRIIGKRFRLVHVYFPGEKILEVATFRKGDVGDSNVFGTLEEDVRRRDFTLNALFYDPKDQTIVDFVGGVKDIRSRRLKPIIPLKHIFQEDPVRMLRALKYAVANRFRVPWSVAWTIRGQAPLLAQISPSRLTEEFFKILVSGATHTVFQAAQSYRLLAHFLPAFSEFLKKQPRVLLRSLEDLDRYQSGLEEKDRAMGLKHLLMPYIEFSGMKPNHHETEVFEGLFTWSKQAMTPIVPPNRELEEALKLCYRDWGLKTPRRRPPRSAVAPGDEAPGGAKPPEALGRRRRRRRKGRGASPAASSGPTES